MVAQICNSSTKVAEDCKFEAGLCDIMGFSSAGALWQDPVLNPTRKTFYSVEF